MFNVFNVKPHTSVRRQAATTRAVPTAATAPSSSHRRPSIDTASASSPNPKAPADANRHVMASAASASPTGRSHARTTTGGQPARPLAASQPAPPLPPLTENTVRNTLAASVSAGVRSSLPRRAVGEPSPSVNSNNNNSGGAPHARPEEPVPSPPTSRLPSHVRRLSAENRSPSAGPSAVNPYASAAPAARASVIPPGSLNESPSRSAAPLPRPQHGTTAQAPPTSALALAREKESRVSRVHRLSSPQRDRVRSTADAGSTLPHSEELGSNTGLWWGPGVGADAAEVPSRPQPLDYYNGTRGFAARPERVVTLPLRTAGAIAAPDKEGPAETSGNKPTRHNTATQVTVETGGVSGKNTPPRGHEVQRGKHGLAGATPWRRPDYQDVEDEEEVQDNAPAYLARVPQPPPPPPPLPPRVNTEEAVAVSPPRQELRRHCFARYLDDPAGLSSVERRRAEPVRAPAARILPEESPYRQRQRQSPPRTSTSPMRQPSWRDASESIPRPGPHPHSSSPPPPPVAATLGHREEHLGASRASEEVASVASTTTSARARQYRPKPKPVSQTHQQATPASATVVPAQPAAAARAVAPAPAVRGSSAGSELSSIASTLHHMKGQRRPSWRRLAPFFPELEFDGKSDAQIVREMEDALRVLSSPPKAPPPPRQSQPSRAPLPTSWTSQASQPRGSQPLPDVLRASTHQSGVTPTSEGPPTQQPHRTDSPSGPRGSTTHTYITGRASVNAAHGTSTAPPQGPEAGTAPSAVLLHASEHLSSVSASARSQRSLTSSAVVSKPVEVTALPETNTEMLSSPSRQSSLSAAVEEESVPTVVCLRSAEVEAPHAVAPSRSEARPPVTVAPIAMDRLTAQQSGATSSPRSGKSSPRYFVPRAEANAIRGGSSHAPTSGNRLACAVPAHRRQSSVTSTPIAASLRPSSHTATTVVLRDEAAVSSTGIPALPQWMCGDAVEAVLLDAYMQLCDLESQYFRLDVETQEEIEDTVHVVTLNEYGRATGSPRRFQSKGTDQEVLPLLRFSEDVAIPAYDLSREGFINLCAGMWLTRFQSFNDIRDLTSELGWSTGSPSASFSLLRESYRDASRSLDAEGILCETAHGLDAWMPNFDGPTNLLEQLDNLVSWAVRTWVERKVRAGAEENSAPLSLTPTPFDAAALAQNGDSGSAITQARRRGPPGSPRMTPSSLASTTARQRSEHTASLSADALSGNVRYDAVSCFCARDLQDASLHLDCWPTGIWTSASSPSLVEHATTFVTCAVDPELAKKRADIIARLAATAEPGVPEAQRTWSLFLGAAQWNADDDVPEGAATMSLKVARVAYSFVSRARTYNLTGGVGALFHSFLTSQLPETAFLDSMFMLEKLRLSLLHSPCLVPRRAARTEAVKHSASARSEHSRGGAVTATADDDDDGVAHDPCHSPTVYDLALALNHFFPLKEAAARLVLFEALVEDLQFLGRLTSLERSVASRVVVVAPTDQLGTNARRGDSAETELVGEWDELSTEDSTSRPPQSTTAATTAVAPGMKDYDGATEVDGDDEAPTFASEGARVMLWAADLYKEAGTVLPIPPTCVRASDEDNDVDEYSGASHHFSSSFFAEADVWALLATPVPVDALFRYRCAVSSPGLKSPNRSTCVSSPAEAEPEKESTLLYAPPVGCKSRLVEAVRLQYVCELLQYITDMQEAILGAKRFEAPAATAFLAQRLARAETNSGDGDVPAQRRRQSSHETISVDATAEEGEEEDEAVDAHSVEQVTTVRAVLLALQRADSYKSEVEIQEYLRHLLVLYYSNHTVDDLFVDEEEPAEVYLARSTTADLSMQDWFEPNARALARNGRDAKAKCDEVFVHIQELAGLCPRVLARRTSVEFDPFAVEL